jgi:glycosyltransferase involved in cell wall biosynthesis
VSTCDLRGGAELSAWNLFKTYPAHGHKAWLAVGNKHTDHPDVVLIPNDSCRSWWTKASLGVKNRFRSVAGNMREMDRLAYVLRWLREPQRLLEYERGHEDFDFPGTSRLLQLTEPPDLVHCFNLHGAYFDLRVLTWLSHRLPVLLDLRDAWLLSGHCGHSLGCERWKTGCGNCPDLTLYPAIRRDATAYNWQRKRDIYARSRFYVATPCQWLMKKAQQSMLAPTVVEWRIIPTGVDLTIFHPADKAKTREALGIPQQAQVLLFVANTPRRNVWKDYDTMRSAVSRVAERSHGQILFIVLGEEAPRERISKAEVHFISYQKEPKTVARYYQAADLYLHAAKADSFPRAVLEALACGTPVVATAVGGITEQVKGLDTFNSAFLNRDWNIYTIDEATGILVSAGDATGMAHAVERLLDTALLRNRLGENAARDACQRFDLQKQSMRYLEWYEELLRGVVSGTVAKTAGDLVQGVTRH